MERVRNICNHLLINIALTQEEEKWLCRFSNPPPLILNRLLRYPKKSTIISAWVKEYFYVDEYRNRRAEFISWIIDENPQYEVDKQVLIDDFNYHNKIDKRAIKEYVTEAEAVFYIENDLSELLASKEESSNIYDRENGKIFLPLKKPELKLTRRNYGVPLDINSPDYVGGYLPDFEKLQTRFYETLDTFQYLTMIWGIAYSRLSDTEKFELFKKYYTEDTSYSLIKIASRAKNLTMLNWLLER